MGYSNGQLETSSGTGRGERGEPGLPGIGFHLTDDGNFDLDSKRLTDVADPVHLQDVATKKYVDDHISSGAASKKYVDDENARQDIAIDSKAEKNEVALLNAKDNIDMSNFRIYNLPLPAGPRQPATKTYVDQKNSQQDIAINSKAEGDEVPFLDGSKSMKGNLQMGKKKITDLGDGSSSKDAVNFSQLLSHTDNHQVNYHLQPSFTFYKNQTIINPINIPNAIPNHNHLDLYIASKVSSNNGFGGQAWVSLRMTNTLKTGLYTVVFETFAGPLGSSTLNDETLITQVSGDGNYQVINFSHDYQTTHSKAYIQFTSNGQAGEITFEIRYYGSSYNQDLKFLFFSRVISGRQNNTFNHALFNVNSVQYQNQIMYFEDINLNQNRIIKLQDPIDDNDAANKKYVDSQVGNVDLTAYLRRDGSKAMTGNLQMGDHTITGIRSSSQDNAALTNGGAKSLYLPLAGNKGMQGILNMSNNEIRYLKMPPNDPSSGNPPDDCALNFKYFHSQRGDLERQINEVGSKALSIDGSDPMGGNLDMSKNNIINLKDPLPSNSQYAASVNFVNKSISDSNANLSKIIDSKITEAEKFNIKSSTQNNDFLFVMDDDLFKEDDNDITKVGKVDKDFYQIKKATYQFTIKYDSTIKYYSTRLSIDLISLPLGEYTLVFEMYYSDKTNQNQVTVNATSGSLTVSRTNTNTFGNHSRSIINFHKYIFSSSYEDLDIDIALKNRAGESYDPNTTIYVIVYGVTGHQNEVSTLVWDSAFALENKALKLKAKIDINEHNIINIDNLSFKDSFDMKKKQIKNLGDGNENGDAVNVKQLNESESTLAKFINGKITEVNKNLGTQKEEFISNLNDLICDYSFLNWKVCEFYVTDGNDYDGSLLDRKPNGPFLKLEQSDINKQPVVVANSHAGKIYFSFNAGEWLQVNYSLNDKEYISVFIVYSLGAETSVKINGLWEDFKSGNSRYISFKYLRNSKRNLEIKSGNERTTITSFPSKANPTSANRINFISVHYNTKNVNNSEFYCNGKQLDRFITDDLDRQNTFIIGEASGIGGTSRYQAKKRIYYFSLF